MFVHFSFYETFSIDCIQITKLKLFLPSQNTQGLSISRPKCKSSKENQQARQSRKGLSFSNVTCSLKTEIRCRAVQTICCRLFLAFRLFNPEYRYSREAKNSERSGPRGNIRRKCAIMYYLIRRHGVISIYDVQMERALSNSVSRYQSPNT